MEKDKTVKDSYMDAINSLCEEIFSKKNSDKQKGLEEYKQEAY